MTTVPQRLTSFSLKFTGIINEPLHHVVKLDEKSVNLSETNVKLNGKTVKTNENFVIFCGAVVKMHENYCEMRREKV